ncbi:MAG: hypothetical protein GY816_15895, partial [Cytophagales bacterium]|nr:hypothetical protein [Cytophagales bacterium]
MQTDKAKKIFYQLGTTPDQEYRARALYQYANLLKLESEFIVADSIFSNLVTFPDVDPELINLSRKQKEGCQLALQSTTEEKGFHVQLVEKVNSKYHDFGAVVNPSNGHLVFATTRNLPGTQYEGSQFSGVLPDLVSYEVKNNGKLDYSPGDQRFDRLNTQWAEGAGSFLEDGTVFYFTTCEGKKEADCAIMASYLVDNKWTDPVSLNEYINEPDSENKQPFISKGGDTLASTSRTLGGSGGRDLRMRLKG